MMADTSMSATKSASSPVTTSNAETTTQSSSQSPPLYLAEGLVAIHKPLTWTSNDVVAYIRGILTRDARDRGYDEDNNNNNTNTNNNKKKRGRRKKQLMKVGHGGTLDPLASGLLVLGIGKGTTLLQDYLQGDKQYTATCELGYETDTLDAEGKLVKTLPWDHVTDIATVEEKVVPNFTGKIQQVPPLYSAIRVDGKRLYEIARSDDPNTKADDVEIPKREVEVYGLQVGSTLEDSVICSGVVDGPRYREEVQRLEKVAEAAAKAANEDVSDANANNEDSGEDEETVSKSKKKRQRRGGRNNKKKNDTKKCPFNEQNVPTIQSAKDNLQLPQFSLNVQCGGGTYIRSLVRDIGYELDTCATMTGLVRTKQGPFVLADALTKDDWTAEKIYEALQKSKERLGST